MLYVFMFLMQGQQQQQEIIDTIGINVFKVLFTNYSKISHVLYVVISMLCSKV